VGVVKRGDSYNTYFGEAGELLQICMGNVESEGSRGSWDAKGHDSKSRANHVAVLFVSAAKRERKSRAVR
jgi:hypothetical protein